MSEAKTARELIEKAIKMLPHFPSMAIDTAKINLNLALTALDAEQKEVNYKKGRIDRMIARHRKYKEESQDQRIRLIEKYAAEQKEKERLQAENKKLKGTCICMDCGKIIKTVEQSKHNAECERAKQALKKGRE